MLNHSGPKPRSLHEWKGGPRVVLLAESTDRQRFVRDCALDFDSALWIMPELCKYAQTFLLVIAALVMALSSLQLPALTTAHSQRLFHVLAVLMSQPAHACTLLALEVELPCVIIMRSRLALEAELPRSFAVHCQ